MSRKDSKNELLEMLNLKKLESLGEKDRSIYAIYNDKYGKSSVNEIDKKIKAEEQELKKLKENREQRKEKLKPLIEKQKGEYIGELTNKKSAFEAEIADIPDRDNRTPDQSKKYYELDEELKNINEVLAGLNNPNTNAISRGKYGFNEFDICKNDLEYLAIEDGINKKGHDIEGMKSYHDIRQQIATNWKDVDMVKLSNAMHTYKMASQEFSELPWYKKALAHILPSSWYKPSAVLDKVNGYEDALYQIGVTDDMMEEGKVSDNPDDTLKNLNEKARIADTNKDFAKEFTKDNPTVGQKVEVKEQEPIAKNMDK